MQKRALFFHLRQLTKVFTLTVSRWFRNRVCNTLVKGVCGYLWTVHEFEPGFYHSIDLCDIKEMLGLHRLCRTISSQELLSFAATYMLGGTLDETELMHIRESRNGPRNTLSYGHYLHYLRPTIFRKHQTSRNIEFLNISILNSSFKIFVN